MTSKRKIISIVMLLCFSLNLLVFTIDRTAAKLDEKQPLDPKAELDSLTIADLDWQACDIDRDITLPFTPRSSGGYSYDKTDTSLHMEETTGTYLLRAGWYSSFDITNEVFSLEFEGKAKAGHIDAINLAMYVFDNKTKKNLYMVGCYLGTGLETDYISFNSTFITPDITEILIFFLYSDGFSANWGIEFWIQNLVIKTDIEKSSLIDEEVSEIFTSNHSKTMGLFWKDNYLLNTGLNATSGTKSVAKINPLSGEVVEVYEVNMFYDLTFDGTNFWIVFADRDYYLVYKYDSSFNNVGSITLPFDLIGGITTDGTDLFVVDYEADLIHKINRNTGAIISSIPAPGTRVRGLEYREGFLWATDSDSHQFFKISLTDGTILETYNSAFENPFGITIDDEGFIWLTSVSCKLIYKTNVNVISDAVPPVITHPSDITYPEGTSGHSIIWTGTDDNPSIYSVYRDDILVSSSSWSSGIGITYNVDGLSEGTYNFTIVLTDADDLSVSDIVWVTVTHAFITPIINQPDDITYTEGTTGYSIAWTGTDDNPSTYSIYRDDVQVSYSSWSSGVVILYNVDGLSEGTYNFTIVLIDVDGLSVSDTVWVTVTVIPTPPVVTHPDDITYITGITGYFIIWTGTDDLPSTYSIYRDGVLVSSGSWSSGVGISYNVDGLSEGIYIFTIVLMSTDGFSVSDTVWVTVTPTPIPPIIDQPDDITYTEGTTGYSIIWTGTDDNPDYYWIYRDGALVSSGSWSSGVGIAYNVDGLINGVYNFTILITDFDGLSVSDTVWVTVTSAPIPPIIDQPDDITYTEGTTSYSIVWTGTDDNPSAYSIYRDDVLVSSGSWSSGVGIAYNVDGLSEGTYNFTILLVDDDSFSVSDTVWVTVTPAHTPTPPSINHPADITYIEGTTGYSIVWTGTDDNPSTYSIYRDGTLFSSGSWSSGVGIAYDIDGLSEGTYNFTIALMDVDGFSVSDTVWVTVTPAHTPTPPSINHPADITYIEGTTGYSIVWTGTDDNPSTYSIYRDGTLFSSGSWSSGVGIAYDIDGLSEGTYNFTIVLFDTDGLSVSDTVLVTILESETSSTVNVGYSSLAMVVLVSLVSLVLYRKKYLKKNN